MATVYANYAFDMSALDLSRIFDGAYWSGFFDDEYITINGVTYRDIFEVDWEGSGGTYYASVFGGDYINANSAEIFGGTVTGYSEFYWTGSEWLETWGIEDISVSALDFFNAAQTSSTIDDYDIMRSALSGSDTFYLSDGSDVAYGYSGNDLLFGYQGADTLKGGGGNDFLSGGDGNDMLFGGRGNDTLDGGTGDDIIKGGVGDDVILLTAGADDIDGGDGYDILDARGTTGGSGWSASFQNIEEIFASNFNSNTNWSGSSAGIWYHGGAEKDDVTAGSGSDTIEGAGGNDILRGGDGDDTLSGGRGQDILYDNGGDDFVFGGAGNDTIYMGSGADSFNGGAGIDTLIADFTLNTAVFDATFDLQNGTFSTPQFPDYNDTISDIENIEVWGAYSVTVIGDSANNILSTDTGNDKLTGGRGNDFLRGGDGKDKLFGNSGADTLKGGAGNDTLEGGRGKDKLYGSSGTDTLNGGRGSDILSGGGGKDRLDGGAGDDKLTGGGGADKFIFRNNSENDKVTDFTDNLDTLKLDDALWGGGLSEAQVISTFASVVNGDIVFDFGGGDTLTLNGITDTAILLDDLIII